MYCRFLGSKTEAKKKKVNHKQVGLDLSILFISQGMKYDITRDK